MKIIHRHNLSTGEIERVEVADDFFPEDGAAAQAAEPEASAAVLHLESLLEHINQAEKDTLGIKTIADLRAHYEDMLQREWDRTQILLQIVQRIGL